MKNTLSFHILSYHIITYGCQMNKNDSERMAGLLENIGYKKAVGFEVANLVILNTCSIRDKAERRIIGKFHELNHFRKEKKKSMKLAIMGCMPQHAKKMIVEKLDFIDYVVGVNNMEILPNLLAENISLKKQIDLMKPKRKIKDVENFETILNSQKREETHKAWVSIMFGCDKMCTFCIVPFTRGREISRKKENIFKEIESLQEKGIKQVVLLGQNVNSYGKTTYSDYDFSHLLEDIATQFSWLTKIDFLTSYPTDVTDRLIDVIANYENITRNIHFPLQHGDNEILEAMKRHYTVEAYKEKVLRLRKKIPDVKIGTDLIVGFPGEKESHFENMLKTLHEIQFDFANTAAYSSRPRTPASRLKSHVSGQTKKKRLLYLNHTLQEIYRQKKIA